MDEQPKQLLAERTPHPAAAGRPVTASTHTYGATPVHPLLFVEPLPVEAHGSSYLADSSGLDAHPVQALAKTIHSTTSPSRLTRVCNNMYIHAYAFFYTHYKGHRADNDLYVFLKYRPMPLIAPAALLDRPQTALLPIEVTSRTLLLP